MHVDKAMAQIEEIHGHLLKGQIFHGYRTFPVMLMGCLAIAAAWGQFFFRAALSPTGYVAYWTGVAFFAFAMGSGGLVQDYLCAATPAARRKTRIVVGQLLPSLAVGVVLSYGFMQTKDSSLVAFLPALWALLYGLGLLSSRPFLPRMMGWVAGFYLLCGCVLLHRAVGLGIGGLSPWSVGLPFGLGQLVSALALYWNLERDQCESLDSFRRIDHSGKEY